MASNVAMAGSARSRAGSIVSRLMQSRELTLGIVVVVLCGLVGYLTPNFLVLGNLQSVTAMIAIIAIAGLGETLVIITKNIDLSVESTMGVVAYCVGNELTQKHLTVQEAWIFGLAIGIALGATNGVIVTILKVPSIVATLGTLAIFRGIAFFVANGRDVVFSDLPDHYTDPAYASFFGVPYFVILALALIAVMAVILKYTSFGRDLYAVGSNADAAATIGVRARVTVFAAFTIGGFFAGIAGILWGIYFGGIDSTTAGGESLVVIAAVVVGGVSIAGGSGTVIGAALGALFLGLVNNALGVLSVDQSWLQVVYGAVILIAVSVDAIIQRQAQLNKARSRIR